MHRSRRGFAPGTARPPQAPGAACVSSAEASFRLCRRGDGLRSSARLSPALPGHDQGSSGATLRTRCGLCATWVSQPARLLLQRDWAAQAEASWALHGPHPQLCSRPLRPGGPARPGSPASLGGERNQSTGTPAHVPGKASPSARAVLAPRSSTGHLGRPGLRLPTSSGARARCPPHRPQTQERVRRRERESALWASRRALSCARALARSRC